MTSRKLYDKIRTSFLKYKESTYSMRLLIWVFIYRYAGTHIDLFYECLSDYMHKQLMLHGCHGMDDVFSHVTRVYCA